MEKITLNDELSLPVPEGFHTLTEEERGKMKMLQDGPWEGISDPERHILVTAGWKKPAGLAMMFLSEKDLAKNMEKQIRAGLKSAGCSTEGIKNRTIAGTQAQGFSYSYTASGTDMFAESYVMKYNKKIWYFHFYARAVLKEESLKVWNEILDGVRAAG